jgi:hypothetical protein
MGSGMSVFLLFRFIFAFGETIAHAFPPIKRERG